MKKIPDKQCFTIGEAAEILEESVSLVRFWSDSFPKEVRPVRNAKGNRLYSRSDIEALKKIHYFVKERGMTLDGARKLMKDNAGCNDNRAEVVERLKAIKSILVEIKSKI